MADQISRKLSERGDIHRTTRRKRHADGDCIQYQCGKTWSCWDNFKLYFEGSAFDAFSVKISKLETLRDSLETLGIASASELTALVERYGSYNENTPEEEIAAASVVLEENTATALGLCTKGAELTASMAKATELLAQMEDGTYNVTDAVKQELQDAIGTAEEVLKLSTRKKSLKRLATASRP